CELDDVVGDDVGVGSERVDEVGDELLERRRAIEALPDDRPDRVEPVDEQPPVVALGRGDHRFAVDLDERHVGPRPGHEEAVDLGGLDHASSPPLPALDARAASGCTSSVETLHAMAAGSSSHTTAARPSSARCTSPRPPPPSSAPIVSWSACITACARDSRPVTSAPTQNAQPTRGYRPGSTGGSGRAVPPVSASSRSSACQSISSEGSGTTTSARVGSTSAQGVSAKRKPCTVNRRSISSGHCRSTAGASTAVSAATNVTP